MKEKVWINIPAKYKDKLSQWVDFFGYDSEDENGKLVVYRFLTDSKEYEQIVNFLQQNNINYYIFRRVYTFTKKEKDDAQILYFWTDDDAKDSYLSEENIQRCGKCKRIIPQVIRKELHVDYKKIKKCDITTTYNGDVETIISEKVKQIFLRENISGIEFAPVFQLGRDRQIIEGFYHLIMREGIGEVVEPSIVRKENLCSECGMYEVYICQTPLHFKKETWEGLDICYTKNWFGGPPKFKRIIISNRLYKILVENKIKYVYFQPAYLVE